MVCGCSMQRPSAGGTRGAEGMLQFEVQNVPLSRSQVDAVH